MNRKTLGRRLKTILQDVEENYIKESESFFSLTKEIPIKDIISNPDQPRKNFDSSKISELANSIKTYGLLQPIITIRKGNKYLLIAGERRLRASKSLNYESIKSIILGSEQLKKIKELSLIENIQRENLNPIELALGYKKLLDTYGITHEKLSKIINKSRAHITNTIRLLNLSKNIKNMIAAGKLTQGHGKAILSLDRKSTDIITKNIVNEKLSVRDIEKIAKNRNNAKDGKKNQKKELILDEIILKLSENSILASRFSNFIKVEFKNQKDADRFLCLISKNSREG